MHLEDVIKRVQRCTWRLWWCELRGRNRASFKMHLEAVIERVRRCTWRPWWCQLGGRYRVSLKMHLEAGIERVWTSTGRQSMDGAPGTETLFHQSVKSQPWECDKVTLPSSSISNNTSFLLKYLGVPDGSDGSGGTSYPLTENQTWPVAQATDRLAYLPGGSYYTMPLMLATHRVVYYADRFGVRLLLLYVRNVVTYTHCQNDTYITLFAGVAVMQ